MDTETSKMNSVQVDRISLQGESRERVRRWVDQVNHEVRGLRISKNDLVNHLILSHGETLDAEEIGRIRGTYFNDVSFATWLLKEVKAAQKRGESTSIDTLLSAAPKATQRTRPRKPKAEKLAMAEKDLPHSEVGPQVGAAKAEVL